MCMFMSKSTQHIYLQHSLVFERIHIITPLAVGNNSWLRAFFVIDIIISFSLETVSRIHKKLLEKGVNADIIIEMIR